MRARLLMGLLLATSAFAIVAGMLALGSPAKARERRFDERRLEDLAAIERAVDDYHYYHGGLPTTLDDLNKGAGQAPFRDPLTQQTYEYRALDDHGYELCAVFQQPSGRPLGDRAHDTGRKCFKSRAGLR